MSAALAAANTASNTARSDVSPEPTRRAEQLSATPAPAGVGCARLSAAAALDIADQVARELEQTAVERDRAGGHPAGERQLLRDSGLLSLSVPEAFGGDGLSWSTILKVVRRVATADSALAHLLGFHHLQVAGLLLYGNPVQQEGFLKQTIDEQVFWGNALNPLDKRLIAKDTSKGFVLDGQKSYSSGSVGSDMLTISAWHPVTETALIAVIPTRRAGITVEYDWDAFGQRQTDSGTVTFDAVELHAIEVLQPPKTVPTPYSTLRSQIAQSVMGNLYLGIAQGAFEASRRYTRDTAKAWLTSGVAAAVDDPFIEQRYGNLRLMIRAAEALSNQAAEKLDAALAKGQRTTAADRGEVAVAVAEAKVLSHRAGLEVSSQLFEINGAGSTRAKYGFDRFWRNVRVHTLHDPIDYKVRDLGRYALSGRWPEPTPYS
jgi:alkylation response protein AidB-like acyl-CoA dehydrogenase